MKFEAKSGITNGRFGLTHRHRRCRIMRNTMQAKIAERLSVAW